MINTQNEMEMSKETKAYYDELEAQADRQIRREENVSRFASFIIFAMCMCVIALMFVTVIGK